MHAPDTLAFAVRLPLWWRSKWDRPTLANIWHRDPESDGSDDSCGWPWPKLTEPERIWAERLITDEIDNIADFFTGDSLREKIRQASQVMRLVNGYHRPRWRHPRWHLHHWRIEIPLFARLRRWLRLGGE